MFPLKKQNSPPWKANEEFDLKISVKLLNIQRMQKNTAFAKGDFHARFKAKPHPKLLFIMRVSIVSCAILLFTLQLFAFNISKGQDMNATQIVFGTQGVSLKLALQKLEQQTGYTFFYPSEKVEQYNGITLSARQRTIAATLELLLANTKLDFKQQSNGMIVIYEPVQVQIQQKKQQLIYVNGTVVDEHNEPLPGVTIKVRHTMQAWTTNSKGIFRVVSLTDDAILEFSFIGFQTQAYTIKQLAEREKVVIVMKADLSSLDEVQITAYGQTTRRLNTGNQVTVTAEEISRNPVPNVLQALQGRVPGMFIQQQSGQPGRPFDIKIRGTNTISGNGYPLIVVDGVAYPGARLPFISGGLTGIQQGGNGLNYLNPQMIESIDVLKDADATSIYGSRGGYGVILITTKKGKAGAPSFNLNSYTGVTTRGRAPELLNTADYLMLRREAFKNDNVTPNAASPDVNGTWSETAFTDWTKEYIKDYAVTSNTYANYSGGSDNINYLVGGNYTIQNGIEKGKGSNRAGGLNFNINSSTSNKKLTLTFGGSYSSTVNTTVPFDPTDQSSITSAPNAPSFLNPDGTLNWTDYTSNPVAGLNLIYKNVTNNLLSNTQIRYNPVKGLTIQGSFSFNQLSGKELRAQPSSYYNPNQAFFTTSTLNMYNISTWTFEPNANYVTSLGKKGKLSLTVGGTMQKYSSNYNFVTGNDILSNDLLYNPTFANTANISTSYNEVPRRYLGYFGIINYNWADKYILNLTGRYDGSGKFGKNNQFGSFGSAAVAYIISSEPWFANALPFVSFAKIRSSYGTVGGDGIPDYAFLNRFVTGAAYQTQLSITPNSLANPNLQWEKNQKGEVGLTLEFIKSRISIDAAYYYAKTTNQLVPQILSGVTGFAGITINRDAVIKNYGYEFVLNTRNINSRDFTWSSSINFSVPRSILKEYPGIEASGTINYELGKSVTGVKVYKFVGVNPETGNFNFTNAAGVTGEFMPLLGPVQLDAVKDRTEFVDLAPKYYGGFNNSFRYKNFSLDVLFTFTNRLGKNLLGAQLFTPGFFNQNLPLVALTRWQKPGDITNVPKASQGLSAFLMQNNFVNSTGAYESALYARLSNLNFSYDLPGSIVKKAHLTGLKVYVQGQNLFTISKYGGLDPENLGAGMAPLRVFTAGLNLTL
jgi:TonB-linked SusC/RagA family outer membrane protein